MAQAAMFGSVALYAAYYMGEAKLEASMLVVVGGALAAVWAVSFGMLLLTIERKYARTFFSTETGSEFVIKHFLDNACSDELRMEVFSVNQELWRPIRPQVVTWLCSRFKIWKREKPAWFTEALRRSIPTDMLPPRDARGLSIHDASLVQRVSFSLGVHAAESTLSQNQVMPLGPPEADTDTQANSENFEFELEADSEAHWQPPAAAATLKARPS
jgi:hypothetical protein